MTSNLNLEIANLALNINQTTKEEIGEMITEECQDKYSLKDHTHTTFESLQSRDDTGITSISTGTVSVSNLDDLVTAVNPGDIMMSSSITGDSLSIKPDVIRIAKEGTDSTQEIVIDVDDGIKVNNKAVSLEGHKHTKEEITDLGDLNNTYALKDHTHSTYDAAYQRVNELKQVYSWNTGYNGTGTQTTANIIANGGLTVNNKAVSMEGHTHDYAPSNHNHNELSGNLTVSGNVNVTGDVISNLCFGVRDENDLTTFSRMYDLGFDAYSGPEDNLTTTRVMAGDITLKYNTTQYGGRQRYTSISTNGISIESDYEPYIELNGKKVSLEDHTHSEYATKEELAGKADANHKHEYIEISNSNYWLFIDKSCISLTYFDTNESVSIYTGYILLNKDGANMYIYPDRIEWKKNHSTSPITLSFDESGAYINGKKILTA